MFKKTIRGGQVAMHRLRMFKQVLAKSVKWGAVLGIIVVSGHVYLFKANDLHVINVHELISYGKVCFLHQLDQMITPLRKTLGGDNKQVTMVDYRTRYGERRMPIKAAIHDNALVRNFFYCKNFVLQEFKVLIIGFFSSILAIFGLWWWFGEIQEEEKADREYLTAKEAAKYLRHKKLASWLHIDNLPLVKNTETSHLLISGSTGSGKTNLLHHLLPQVRSRGQRAIVIDQTSGLVARYYSKEREDIVFNPMSAGSTWDFFAEMQDEQILYTFATTLFASSLNNHDPMWGEAARQLFVDAVQAVGKMENPTPQKLYEFLSHSSLETLRNSLEKTISSKHLHSSNEKTAMSIMTTVLSKLDWLKALKLTPGSSFTIGEYMKEGSGWLFIVSTPKNRNILQLLQSALLDLSVIHLMELGTNLERRVWFILDELASMKKLVTLPQALSELRQYGGCVVACLQSLTQLITNYSHAEAATIQSQFNTQVYFRIGDFKQAKEISDSFGETIHSKQQESISYGAHEMRDGVQLGSHERIKPLLPVDELMNLKNLECFVKLPEPAVRLVKLQTLFAKI